MFYSLGDISGFLIGILIISSGIYIILGNNPSYDFANIIIFGGIICIVTVIINIKFENQVERQSIILNHIDNSEQEKIRYDQALGYLSNMRDH